MSTMLGIAHTNRRIKHMFRLPLCVCRTGYDSLTQCTARRNWTKHMFGVVNFVDFVDSPPAHSGFINKILRIRLHSFRAWKRIGKNWFLLRFYYITFTTGRRKHTLTHTHATKERQTQTQDTDCDVSNACGWNERLNLLRLQLAVDWHPALSSWRRLCRIFSWSISSHTRTHFSHFDLHTLTLHVVVRFW